MEERLTLDRLYENFNEVIAQLDDIIRRNDIEAARAFLEDLKEIVSNDQHVKLDDDEPLREGTSIPYDHIIHRLIDNIHGMIQTNDRIVEDEELRGYINRRREIDVEISGIDQELEALGEDGFTRINNISIEEFNETIQTVVTQIRRREASLRNRRTTPATRERLTVEIRDLTAYLHELERYGSGREGFDVSYITKEIRVIEREIRQATRRLEELGDPNPENQLDQEISRLEAEEERLAGEAERLRDEFVAAQERGEDTTEIGDQLGAVNEELSGISFRKRELIQIRANKRTIAILERDEADLTRALDENRRRIAILDSNEQHSIDQAEADLQRVTAELTQKRNELTGTENRERISSLEITIASYDADIEELEGRFPSLDEEDHRRLETLYRERDAYQRELEQRRIRQELLDQYGPNREPDNSEREALEAFINERRTRLAELEETRTRIQSGPDQSVTISEREILIRMLEIRIQSLQLQRQAAERNRKRDQVISIDEQIQTITRRITLIRESEQLIGQDNSARRAELEGRRQALITERDELDVLINRKRRELLVPGQELDVEAAAREIGDNILKTADIRQELMERGYTRDDFLNFYRQGKENSQAEMARIQQEIQNVENVARMMIPDESGVNLFEQYRNAEDEATKREVLEKIRVKIQSASPELARQLAEAGFDQDLRTASAEDLARFEGFFGDIRQSSSDILQGLRAEFEEHNENIEIFDREIARIEAELEVGREARAFRDDNGASYEAEKELREKQVRAIIRGDADDETIQQWNEAVERFVEHKTTKTMTYRDADGNPHEIEVDTVGDYEQYEEDAHFLNLENYRQYSEVSSLYDKVLEAEGEEAALAAVKSVVNLKGIEYDEYRRLVDEGQQDQADEWLKNLVAQQKDYVRSYHGFTNKHAVRYATLRTAGSTLEGMLPVRGDLPTTTKMQNALRNVGRFLMIRPPKFTRTNAKGETVPNVLGGVTTLGLDALVVGGAAAAAIVGGPAALIPYGVFYAAKGVVTLGNRIAARREKRRFEEDIDSNKPIITPLTARDREVMRRDHYREVEHYSRPRAWIRAKLDKYFTRGRGRETDEEIAERTVARTDATIDEERYMKATALRRNLAEAERNQEIRNDRTQVELGSAQAYNDMVRDPGSLDMDQASSIAAQNAAIKSVRPDATRRDLNPNSQVARNDKYVKDDVQYAQTSDMGPTDVPKGTASVSPITVDQKYRSAMERQDAINRVLTMILTTAGNLGIAWARGKLKEVRYRQEKEDDQVVTQNRREAVYRDETEMVDDYGTVTRTQVDRDAKVGDLVQGQENYDNTYWAPNRGADSVGGSARVDGVAIRLRDAQGNGVEWSAGEPGSGILAGHHVHGTFSGDISGKTVYDMLTDLRAADPSGYAQYCQATGINPQDFDQVVQHVLENNNMWVQSSNMEGWSQTLGGGLRQVTEQVVVGQHPVTRQVFDHWDLIPEQVVIPGKTISVPYEVISGTRILDEALKGAAIGAGGVMVEAAHEVARPTDKTLRGNHEEVNPDLTYAAIARAAQEEYDRELEERETDNRSDNHDNDTHDNDNHDNDRNDDGDER